jgi:hypothetical protein
MTGNFPVFFPKKTRELGTPNPSSHLKKEEKKRLLDGMASSDLTRKETLCPRRYQANVRMPFEEPCLLFIYIISLLRIYC